MVSPSRACFLLIPYQRERLRWRPPEWDSASPSPSRRYPSAGCERGRSLRTRHPSFRWHPKILGYLLLHHYHQNSDGNFESELVRLSWSQAYRRFRPNYRQILRRHSYRSSESAILGRKVQLGLPVVILLNVDCGHGFGQIGGFQWIVRIDENIVLSCFSSIDRSHVLQVVGAALAYLSSYWLRFWMLQIYKKI